VYREHEGSYEGLTILWMAVTAFECGLIIADREVLALAAG
jgi:hypothetical protein